MGEQARITVASMASIDRAFDISLKMLRYSMTVLEIALVELARPMSERMAQWKLNVAQKIIHYRFLSRLSCSCLIMTKRRAICIWFRESRAPSSASPDCVCVLKDSASGEIDPMS